jgi:ribosomal protein L37E
MLADWRVLPGVLISLSLVLIVFAIVGPILIENKLNDTLASQFLFTEQSGKGWDRWANNTQPDSGRSYVYVYLYNVTNTAAASIGEQPALEELGPWVYRQYLRNVNVQFETFYEERVVSSTPYTYLVFEPTHPDNGNRLESDLITGPNVGFWAVLKSTQLASNPGLLPVVLSICQQNGWGAFTTNNVSSWLFGYSDPLLQLLSTLVPVPTTTVQYIRNQTSEQDAFNQVKTSTVSCGFPNTKRFQQMVRWQQNSTINFWRGNYSVYGSPGNFFGFYRRGAGTDENLFWAQLGRAVPLEVEVETTFKEVNVYRYVFPQSVLQNSSVNPDNYRFFQDGREGLFNATAILGVPIFYSWPHFYRGDTWLNSHYTGVRMPSEDDKSYIEIQPIIGANCHSARKIQGNILFGELNDTASTGITIADLFYFPAYWINISSEITDDQAAEMRDSLAFYDTAKVGSKAILFSCSLISPVLFGIAVVILWKRRNFWRREGEGQLLGFGDETDTGAIHIGYQGTNQMKSVA